MMFKVENNFLLVMKYTCVHAGFRGYILLPLIPILPGPSRFQSKRLASPTLLSRDSQMFPLSDI